MIHCRVCDEPMHVDKESKSGCCYRCVVKNRYSEYAQLIESDKNEKRKEKTEK